MATTLANGSPSWIPLMPVNRPSRLIPQQIKDSNEGYDNQCARFWMSGVDNGRRNSYLNEYVANSLMTSNITGSSSFGSSQQIREVLGDANNPSGRHAWKDTVMQPMHTRIVGACSSMSISAEAKSWAANVKARKDAFLAKRALLASAAELGGPLQEAMQNMHGVQPDAKAEAQQAGNLWTDPYEKTVTNFITALAKHQDFDGMKEQVASNIGRSGIGAVAFFDVGNNIESMVIEPDEFVYDTAHTKRDMTDSNFMGWIPLMDVEALVEQYQPKKDAIIAIERWSNMAATSVGDGSWGWPDRKPRVAKMFYKDIEELWWGFVLVDGMPEYLPICPEEYAKEETARDGVKRYTKADLIESPVNRWTATWTDEEHRNRMQVRYVQKLRFCDMIPWEYMPYGYTLGRRPGSAQWDERRYQLQREGIDVVSAYGDLVLAHGEYSMQERNPDDVFSVVFPIKAASWLNIGGNIIAPLSCVRDVQAVRNATLSDMMMRMTRSDMPTTIFDEGALAGANITQDEAAANLKIGKSFAIQSQLVGGINQAVTTTETGLGADFYNRFGILEQLYMMAQNSTGFYDQNFGAPGSQEQLVRVKELQDRQSGIMMKPLLSCNQSIFTQMHQFNSMAGRQFYAQRPWLLNRFVGDEGERILMASQDMMDEAFRVEVTVSESPEQRREMARTMIIGEGGYVDRQFLDAQTATRLLADGAFPEDVDREAARFTKRLAEAKEQMAQQQQQQAAMAAAGEQMAALNEQEQKLSEQQGKLALGQQKVQAQAMKPLIDAQAEWLRPQDQDFAHEQEAVGS